MLSVDRGMSWERALTRLNLHPGEHNGFYISRREQFNNKRWIILATLKEGSSHLFKIARLDIYLHTALYSVDKIYNVTVFFTGSYMHIINNSLDKLKLLL